MELISQPFITVRDYSKRKFEPGYRTARILPAAILLALLIKTLYPLQAEAQIRTTLFGWEEETRWMITDRYHNYGGPFYDRGLFRFTTPSMTKEHDIDLITYNYSTADDYLWYYEPDTSFRTFFGSFNLGQFIQGAEVRNTVPVGGRVEMPLHFVRRYDMRQDRMLVLLGFNFQIRENHTAGLLHTLTEQKPDLDATFWYRFGEWQNGAVQLEVTALDWANNAAYDLGQRRGTDDPELRRHELRPWLFSFKASSPEYNNLRGELMAGIQTPLQTVGEFEEGSEESFRDRSRNRYIGALIEYAEERFTVGFNWRYRYASFSRENVEEDFNLAVDKGNRQIESSLGAFVALQRGHFYLHNWLWRTFNRDVQRDEHETRHSSGIQLYPFDFSENRWMMRNRLGYDPGERGFLLAVEWSADYRNFLGDDYEYGGTISKAIPYRGFYRFVLTSYNERLTLMFGYRFSRRAFLMVGASYDVDGDLEGGWTTAHVRDKPQRFDGGFGRLMLFW